MYFNHCYQISLQLSNNYTIYRIKIFELYKISNTSILTCIDYMSKPIIMQSFNKDNSVERKKVAFDKKEIMQQLYKDCFITIS